MPCWRSPLRGHNLRRLFTLLFVPALLVLGYVSLSFVSHASRPEAGARKVDVQAWFQSVKGVAFAAVPRVDDFEGDTKSTTDLDQEEGDSLGEAPDRGERKLQVPLRSSGHVCDTVESPNWSWAHMRVNGRERVKIVKRVKDASAGERDSAQPEDEYFIPFSFVRSYFHMQGSLEPRTDVPGEIDWTHSHGRIFLPRPGSYVARGAYLNFQNSSVEWRGRLLCIDGEWEVPRSQRHDRNGYFYPIQIAQYGLKHYSQLLQEGSVADGVSMLDSAKSDCADRKSYWTAWPRNVRQGVVSWTWTKRKQNCVLEFRVPRQVSSVPTEREPAIVFSFAVVKDNASSKGNNLLARLEFSKPGGCLSVDMKVFFHAGKPIQSTVHYLADDGKGKPSIACTGRNVVLYRIGERRVTSSLTRDLLIDVHKGINLCYGNTVFKGRPKMEVKSLALHRVLVRGVGRLFDLSLRVSAHKSMALSSARWLAQHQDVMGSWPVPVERKMTAGRPLTGKSRVRAVLRPGWRSSMAQGQAMSLLVRAYYITKNKTFLHAAFKAIEPFTVPSSKGGVRAVFADRYPWYEEYPTTPPTFVLNGFMFSLLGLYDTAVAAGEVLGQTSGAKARRLFDEGIVSLKAMASLFDTGSGSLYDLHHYQTGDVPNVARAEYHVTHLNLLAALSAILPDEGILKTIHTRWLSYHHGNRIRPN